MKAEEQKIIDSHMKWLTSKGSKGKRGDFSHVSVESSSLDVPQAVGLLSHGVLFNAYDTLRLSGVIDKVHYDLHCMMLENDKRQEKVKLNSTIH